MNGLDLSASYYDGFDNTSVLRESTVAVGPLPATVRRLTPVYYTFDELPVKWRVEAILEYSRENVLDKRAHSGYG